MKEALRYSSKIFKFLLSGESTKPYFETKSQLISGKRNTDKVLMDGKGRATDNAFIERFFRTLKQKYVYLYPPKDGSHLYQGTQNFMEYYNNRRHRGIQRNRHHHSYILMLLDVF